MAKKVLFVCIHNSARSQIAEAFLNREGNGEIIAESAGFEPGILNPLAVEVMSEVGIDISNNTTDSVFEFFKQGRRYNYIITVCDEGAAEKCPIFPGIQKRIHWSFEDPSSFRSTSHEENLQKTRSVRDDIAKKVHELAELIKAGKLEDNAPKDWKIW